MFTTAFATVFATAFTTVFATVFTTVFTTVFATAPPQAPARRWFPRIMLLLGCIGYTASVRADVSFLQHRVNDPLNFLGAIPALSSPGVNTWVFDVAVTHANVFAGGTDDEAPFDELLVMDGAISTVDFRAQWALSSCLDAAVSTQLVSHWGGRFDRYISQWHDVFSLPDANRDAFAYNDLTVFFSNTGLAEDTTAAYTATQTELTSPSQSLGDVWLSVQTPWRCWDASNTNTSKSGHSRLGVKVPIGSSSWSSAGQTAVFADWHSASIPLSERASWVWSAGTSISDSWDARYQALAPRRVLAYGAVAAEYRWNVRWAAMVQLDFRSPVFHSSLTELGHWGVQMHLGIAANINRRHAITASFSEDAVIDTAPDIGVRLAYRYTPN